MYSIGLMFHRGRIRKTPGCLKSRLRIFQGLLAIDTARLNNFLQMIDGDISVLIHLIRAFLRDVPKKLESLREAFDQGDPAAMRLEAHGMKSSGAVICAGIFSGLCGELEILVSSGAAEGAEELLLLIETEYKRVEEDLRSILR